MCENQDGIQVRTNLFIGGVGCLAHVEKSMARVRVLSFVHDLQSTLVCRMHNIV